MTDREVDEKISRFLEPKPTYEGDLYISVRRCWWRDDSDGKWQPIAWRHSEEANAKLLEALRQKFPYLSFTFEPGSVEVEAGGCGNLENFYIVFKTEDRKRAVWLAFQKFAGIEGGQHERGD